MIVCWSPGRRRSGNKAIMFLYSCFVLECLTWRSAPQPRAELVHHFAVEDPGESAEAEVAGRLRLPEGAEGAGDVTLQNS